MDFEEEQPKKSKYRPRMFCSDCNKELCYEIGLKHRNEKQHYVTKVLPEDYENNKYFNRKFAFNNKQYIKKYLEKKGLTYDYEKK